MRKALLLLLFLPLAAPAYDVNGVDLGGSEAQVKKTFPSVHCKPLEWKSNAAERRCDDARIAVGGIEAKATFYLKADAVQGYDLRFDTKDLERMKALLKKRWGAPLAEATDVVAQKGKEDRKIYKMRWEKGADVAILTAQIERKRATLEVGRGSFSNEISRVR